ncbi:hypothetical protein [Corticibacter populi]|uniref:hypothetical protein n=1 Tax=Corticibacter populi TaxID=1550736 RepID=UPI0010CF943F|nr:hypothetical protein [Corticibacter populi]RZS29497.1 hypothetical protein EV687_3745 [Corticibacter populi]
MPIYRISSIDCRAAHAAWRGLAVHCGIGLAPGIRMMDAHAHSAAITTKTIKG